MWSLGVILYILLSGLPPFWGNTEEQIFGMVRGGGLSPRDLLALAMGAGTAPLVPQAAAQREYARASRDAQTKGHTPPQVLKGKVDFTTEPWPRISAAAKDCVMKLLTMDPSKRATAQEILQARFALYSVRRFPGPLR